jgi:hypothetical protein
MPSEMYLVHRISSLISDCPGNLPGQFCFQLNISFEWFWRVSSRMGLAEKCVALLPNQAVRCYELQ